MLLLNFAHSTKSLAFTLLYLQLNFYFSTYICVFKEWFFFFGSGIILYNSRQNKNKGDYVAFGMQDGYAVYQFDVGAGMVSLTSDQPLALNEWHTVKLNRNRKNGKLSPSFWLAGQIYTVIIRIKWEWLYDCE